jgi:hypothetical protein
MSSNTVWGHPPPSHMTVQCTFGTESRRSRARAETVKLVTVAASAEDRSCMHKTRVERTSTQHKIQSHTCVAAATARLAPCCGAPLGAHASRSALRARSYSRRRAVILAAPCSVLYTSQKKRRSPASPAAQPSRAASQRVRRVRSSASRTTRHPRPRRGLPNMHAAWSLVLFVRSSPRDVQQRKRAHRTPHGDAAGRYKYMLCRCSRPDGQQRHGGGAQEHAGVHAALHRAPAQVAAAEPLGHESQQSRV